MRPGDVAWTTLRDKIEFHPHHMRWELASEPALHVRLEQRIEHLSTRVLIVARIGADGQAPCHTA